MSRHYEDPTAHRLTADLTLAVELEKGRRGMSLKEVGAAAGISYVVVANLLAGRGIGFDSFCALARWAGYRVYMERPPEAPPGVDPATGEFEPDEGGDAS